MHDAARAGPPVYLNSNTRFSAGDTLTYVREGGHDAVVD